MDPSIINPDICQQQASNSVEYKLEPLSLEYQHLLNPQQNPATPLEEIKRSGLENKSLDDPDSSLIKQEEKNLQIADGSEAAKFEEKTTDVKKEGDNLNEILNNTGPAGMSPKNGNSKRPYNKKTMEKIKRWTKEESALYEQFIEMYADIFNDPSSKRVTKIFIFMSKYIGTKTPSQCRSHHQKFFKKIQGMKSVGVMNPTGNNPHLRNKEGLEELNKFQNSEKKKRGKYSKKQNPNVTPNNEEMNKNMNPFDFPFDENLKMQFKHQFENDPTGSFLAYPGMFNLNSFQQNNRPPQQDTNLMNMYSQLNNNIRKSFEMLNKEYGRKPQVNDERELLNMFSNPNQRKNNNMPYFFNNSNGMESSDFNNFEKVLNSTQYFNQNPSFPPLFPGIAPQVNPYNFPVTPQINPNMSFNPNAMVSDPNKMTYGDPAQKNEDGQNFFGQNQFPNWVVGQTTGLPNGVFNNGPTDFDLNFLKNRGMGFQNAGMDPSESMKYGKVENMDNNMETYLKNLTKYF